MEPEDLPRFELGFAGSKPAVITATPQILKDDSNRIRTGVGQNARRILRPLPSTTWICCRCPVRESNAECWFGGPTCYHYTNEAKRRTVSFFFIVTALGANRKESNLQPRGVQSRALPLSYDGVLTVRLELTSLRSQRSALPLSYASRCLRKDSNPDLGPIVWTTCCSVALHRR